MLKFLRNTHNPDGTYRFLQTRLAAADEICAENPNNFTGDRKLFPMYGDAGLVVHLLNPFTPMTFFELVRECQEYSIYTEGYENGLDVITKEQVALALVACLEQDLAKVVTGTAKVSGEVV